MEVKEIIAKNMLVKSKLPDADYVVNPYTGCEFGCSYCYASFMSKFVNQPISNWGNYVYAKVNAIEVFKKDLEKMKSSERNSSILFSSVTDCYQGIEAKYKLTRGMLQLLADFEYPGEVGILTKSSMITRDIDIIRRLKNPDIGMTITTSDDKLSRFLEAHATASSARIATLKKLHDEGITPYAFIGPLLPHFRYKPELLDDLFAKLKNAGVNSIYVEHINLSNYIKVRLFDAINDEPEEVKKVYMNAESDEHRKALDEIVSRLVDKHGLTLREGEVLYHNREKGGWKDSWPTK